MTQSTERKTDDPTFTVADRSSTALATGSARRADRDIVGRASDLTHFERRVEAVVPQLLLLIRIRAEFLQTPDLRMTHEQAYRLCGMEHTRCQRVLDTLVDMKFSVRGFGWHVCTDDETRKTSGGSSSTRLEPPARVMRRTPALSP
jgi:hypothetical protein